MLYECELFFPTREQILGPILGSSYSFLCHKPSLSTVMSLAFHNNLFTVGTLSHQEKRSLKFSILHLRRQQSISKLPLIVLAGPPVSLAPFRCQTFWKSCLYLGLPWGPSSLASPPLTMGTSLDLLVFPPSLCRCPSHFLLSVCLGSV